MSNQIVQRGLARELEVAKKDLRRAFRKVSKLVEFNGSLQTQVRGYNDPRSVVEEAITMLREAAEYYDAVKAEMDSQDQQNGRAGEQTPNPTNSPEESVAAPNVTERGR